MKQPFLLIMAAMAVISCGTSTTKDNDPWGQLNPGDANQQSASFNGSMHSNAMGRDMTFSVWIPAGYDKNKTYPFLYLLHGYEDGNQSATWNRCWLDKGNAAKIADDYVKGGGVPMVIIFPNGLDKFYINNGYETFFEEEFMAYVESEYKCNGKRAIAGLSMGGYGTIYHALKYPKKFTYAYPMSPAADASWSSFVDKQSDKSVFPPFTFEVGLQDMTVNNNTTKTLYNSLTKKGLTCEWVERDGTHDWAFWKGCLPKVLIKVGNSFK